jgi:hypothetical protein
MGVHTYVLHKNLFYFSKKNMRILLLVLIALNVSFLSAQKDFEVKWSSNVYKDLPLMGSSMSTSLTDLIKISDNHLFYFYQSTFNINTFSLTSLVLKGSFELSKMNKSYNGIDYNFKNLSFGYISKIHSINGKIGIEGFKIEKDKGTKSFIVNSAFFPFNSDYSSIDKKPVNPITLTYEKGWAKTALYPSKNLIHSTDYYSVNRCWRQTGKSVQIVRPGVRPGAPGVRPGAPGGIMNIPYDLEIISRDNTKHYHNCESQNVYARRSFGRSNVHINVPFLRDEIAIYNTALLHQEDDGIYFIFNNKNYLKQTWNNSENTVEFYDGISNRLVSTIKLEGTKRVAAFKILENGKIVLGGFSGDDFEVDKSASSSFKKGVLVINSLFRIVLDNSGKKIETESRQSKITPPSGKNRTILVHQVKITKNGGLFFPITEIGKTTTTDKLTVFGLMNDGEWKKSIPFHQGLPKALNNINPTAPLHLGVQVAECGNEIVIAYNDASENHDKYDYNSYTYDSENLPKKYVCSKHKGITLLRINNSGDLKSLTIAENEEKLSLLYLIEINENQVFITTSDKNMTYIATVTLLK